MDWSSHLLNQNEIKIEFMCTVCLYSTFQHVQDWLPHLLLDMSNPTLWEVQVSANVKTKKKTLLKYGSTNISILFRFVYYFWNVKKIGVLIILQG